MEATETCGAGASGSRLGRNFADGATVCSGRSETLKSRSLRIRPRPQRRIEEGHFGPLHYGVARRCDGFTYTIRVRNCDHGSGGRPLSAGNSGDQHHRFVFDWTPDDALHGTTGPASEFALPPRHRFFGRIHYVFELRVGVSGLGAGRQRLARIGERGWQRAIWIYCRVAGSSHGRQAIRTERNAMLIKGTAKKVTIYINEDTQHHLGSLD